jgi:outer membrane protein assembly factor BamD (BamD/ComL family)
MKRLILVLVMIAALSIGGCSGGNARELFETAQLEELQNNRDHAIKLYREIIEKNPESEYAGKARKRLDALEQAKH